jgi:D-glucuronyl C5-epimerase C-terminus
MPARARALLATAAILAGLAVAAGTAQAGELIVVKGDSARRVNDPLTPPASQLEAPRAGRAVAVASSVRGRRAVGRVLRRGRRKHSISRSRFNRYVRIYRQARRVRRGLRGARGTQLGYVIASLERTALTGRLIPSRMPSWFAQVQRNTAYWPHRAFPGSGDFVSFGRSEILYRYFPGRGLQFHPLGTFKRANLIHGACKGVVEAPCSKTRLRRLLDEMARFAVRRSKRWIAWEYIFDFGGGSPPWISGMADATGIQALGRAALLLGRPRYARIARKALGAFGSSAPLGVKTRGFRGGVHYLQYSFAPHTYIFNAFTQSLLGLYDFSKDAGDARARRFYDRAEPELEREIPFSDLGDWSMYSYRGEVSDRNYHELLREVLNSMCTRHLGDLYCTYAERYRRYQTEPPKIEITGPDTTTTGHLTRIRFTLSKLSAVELQISRDGRVGVDKIATFHRGSGSFSWRPDSRGTYTVRLGAKEQRTGKGLKGHDSATIEVD